jgi:hypothetical protein
MSARVVNANGGNNGVIVFVAAYAPETVVVTVLAVDEIVSVYRTVALVAGALVDVMVTVRGILDVTCGPTLSWNVRI